MYVPGIQPSVTGDYCADPTTGTDDILSKKWECPSGCDQRLDGVRCSNVGSVSTPCDASQWAASECREACEKPGCSPVVDEVQYELCGGKEDCPDTRLVECEVGCKKRVDEPFVGGTAMKQPPETCDVFEANQFCKTDGGYGPGWPTYAERFNEYPDSNGNLATTACCACGGGRATCEHGYAKHESMCYRCPGQLCGWNGAAGTCVVPPPKPLAAVCKCKPGWKVNGDGECRFCLPGYVFFYTYMS